MELPLKVTEMSLESCLPAEEVFRISLGDPWLIYRLLVRLFTAVEPFQMKH